MSAPNPYASPAEIVDAEVAKLRQRDELLPVAITLIVFSVLWIFLGLNGLAFFYITTAIASAEAQPGAFDGVWLPMLGIATTILYQFVLLSGAFSMVRKGSYVWAFATCCLACVPILTPCYFLGMIPGIWGIIVLRRPHVRAAFRTN
ncbi:hypothetical protein [Anatilimnocola floriformis]|uniref:hypothetical protein n=1 Tax=Anatilimnocola floriformis TaxID=2948575 RepID=UPI0020C217C1|nr:hypothetical protein [Anatilimnocola floriformis]